MKIARYVSALVLLTSFVQPVSAFAAEDEGGIEVIFPSHPIVYVSTSGSDATGDGSMENPVQTISYGVTLVDEGGTVHVGSGVFEEQVTVEKSLKLEGEGGASTYVKAPSALSDTGFGKNVVTVNTAGNVEITNLKVTGPGSSGCASIDYGIFVGGGATASLHDLSVSEIRDNPFSGCQNGGAIRVGSEYLSTIGTATISGNLISGYQKNGIVVDGAGSRAVISGNTVTGAGATTVLAQNGIQISRGATGTISGNTVSGNEWDCGCADPMDTWQAGGILLYSTGAGVVVSGNTITENDYGIDTSLVGEGTTTITGNTISDNRFVGVYFEDGDVDFSRNSITGTDIALYSYTEGTADASENYFGRESGPAETEISGDITFSPWYVDAEMTRLSDESPDAPVPASPINGRRMHQSELTVINWSDVEAKYDDATITYSYESALLASHETNEDGSFVTPVYTTSGLTESSIAADGTPEGDYFWHVKTTDSYGNESAWSDLASFSIVPDSENTTPRTHGGSGYIPPQNTPAGEVLGDSDEDVTPPGEVLGDTDEDTDEPEEVIDVKTYIRTEGMDTVYFVDENMVRHPVIDAQTYFTYTNTWDDVKFVSEEAFAKLTLGKPVLPKAGVVLVKIQSSNRVYALELDEAGNTVLRMIPDEITASFIYGADWQDYVIDVEPTHFKRFVMGDDVDGNYKPMHLDRMKTRMELNNH
jgi:hypothetical protein